MNVIGQIADRDLPLLAVIGADQAVAFSIAG
ncbi:MAG TPA: hypothetical protein VIU11_20570 [Nakamurella sp.]